MHIDAAYAGSAFICPEFRYLLNGVEVRNSPPKSKWIHWVFSSSLSFYSGEKKEKSTCAEGWILGLSCILISIARVLLFGFFHFFSASRGVQCLFLLFFGSGCWIQQSFRRRCWRSQIIPIPLPPQLLFLALRRVIPGIGGSEGLMVMRGGSPMVLMEVVEEWLHRLSTLQFSSLNHFAISLNYCLTILGI